MYSRNPPPVLHHRQSAIAAPPDNNISQQPATTLVAPIQPPPLPDDPAFLPPSAASQHSSPAGARSPVSETPTPPSPCSADALSISPGDPCRSVHPWRKKVREEEVVWWV
ncbi:unnamed protein product [Linum trigynum]|uniref:Uncharacterized protein n=1 Tax=Linum trigynum TaxID=586398 RepID=A0AAV2CWG6_9ROSI